MPKRLALTACVVGNVLILSAARGDEGGFNLSKLNPFASRGETEDESAEEPPRERVASRVSSERPAGKESAGFAWPSLPAPKWPALSRGASSSTSAMDHDERSAAGESSTWDKLSSGTRQLFSKTKQTLMPWSSDDEKSSSSTSAVKRRTARSTSRSRSKSEKKPFFSSFWNSEEEESVQTVSDYLALPRVPY